MMISIEHRVVMISRGICCKFGSPKSRGNKGGSLICIQPWWKDGGWPWIFRGRVVQTWFSQAPALGHLCRWLSLTLDFLNCKVNRLCIKNCFCPPAPVFCPCWTPSYSPMFHTLTSQRMFIIAVVPRLFFAVNRGTLKNHYIRPQTLGVHIWSGKRWGKNIKKTINWWCTLKKENKPSSLINRLCQERL